MHLKASYKYMLWQCLRVLGIFAMIIGINAIFFLIMDAPGGNNGNIIEQFITTIFNSPQADMIAILFGAVAIKEQILLLTQSGVSRRTYFISEILTLLTLSIVLSGINLIVSIPFATNPDFTGSLSSSGLLNSVVTAKDSGYFIMLFLLGAAQYFFLSLIGAFFGVLFYRIPMAWRIFLGIVLASAFCGGLMIYLMGSGLAIYSKAEYIIDVAFGISRGLPYMGALTLFSLALLSALFYWLILRRTPINTRK